MHSNIPQIIHLQSIGSSELGYIAVAEQYKNIPFEVKRVYWTYFTPQNVIRGYHAHKQLQQVIFAVSGIIKMMVETKDEEKMNFMLDKPEKGLYLPPYTWHEMQFTQNAVLLSLASELFDEADYIRDYEEFKK
jgi:dTDP-4-dehydrorhamnose 3,5-epimerase-like enzyme